VSKVISGKKLQKAIIDNEFLSGGDISNCDGIKYDFRLDDCILKAKYGVPINYSSGGLAIDPGYHGKLLFGLYNISSEDFKLVPNAKLVGAVFFKLEGDEILADYTPPKPVDGFSSTLIEKIAKYQPVGINTLEDAFKELERQFETFKKGLSKNSDAIEKLEDLMRNTSRNIDIISQDVKNLSEGLKIEAESRKNISKEVDMKIAALKGALWLATSIGGAIVLLFIGVLTGLIKIN